MEAQLYYRETRRLLVEGCKNLCREEESTNERSEAVNLLKYIRGLDISRDGLFFGMIWELLDGIRLILLDFLGFRG